MSSPVQLSVFTEEFHFVLEDLFTLRHSRYSCIASLAIVIYDILLTFDAERQYVWQQLKPPHTLVSAMFIANRYGNAILLALLNAQFAGSWSPHYPAFCEAFTVTTNLLILIALASINACIPVRRTWGAWIGGGQRKATRYLGTVFIAYFVASASLLLYGSLAGYSGARMDAHGTCINYLPPWLWVFWIPSIALNSTVFVLSFMKLHGHVKTSNTSYIIRTAYSDGMIYYLFSLTVDLWNILYWAFGTSAYRHTMSLTLTLAAMNVVSQRLVLRLRASDAMDYNDDHMLTTFSKDLEVFTDSRPTSPLVFEDPPKSPKVERRFPKVTIHRSTRLSHISEEVESPVSPSVRTVVGGE